MQRHLFVFVSFVIVMNAGAPALADEPVATMTDKATVYSIAFSPDAKWLASGSADHEVYVKLWSVPDGKPIRAFKGHQKPVLAVAFSPDGRTLATGGIDRTARLWDPATGAAHATLTGHQGDVNAVAFSPDGKLLATTSRDKTLRLWDPATGKQVRSIPTDDILVTVVFSAGSEMVIAAGSRGLRAWDATNGTRIDALGNWSTSHSAIAISLDGTLMATGSDDKMVRVGTLKGEPAAMKGHRSHVLGVAFHPQGKTLASAGKDFTIRLWNVEKQAEKQTIAAHTHTIYAIAYSPDGAHFASASEDKTIKLWAVK